MDQDIANNTNAYEFRQTIKLDVRFVLKHTQNTLRFDKTRYNAEIKWGKIAIDEASLNNGNI